jgi:hypothetical protein
VQGERSGSTDPDGQIVCDSAHHSGPKKNALRKKFSSQKKCNENSPTGTCQKKTLQKNVLPPEKALGTCQGVCTDGKTRAADGSGDATNKCPSENSAIGRPYSNINVPDASQHLKCLLDQYHIQVMPTMAHRQDIPLGHQKQTSLSKRKKNWGRKTKRDHKEVWANQKCVPPGHEKIDDTY